MGGMLYVVGTPIGNLGDRSPRAVETLRQADFIAAEDTRVSLKLLNRFEIKKPLVSYYEHNLRERGEYILSRLLAGECCAVVTDAGMPCISDPGEDLVRLCAEQGVPVAVVPGPSAAVSALALSGLSTSRFAFEGFLSTNRRNRLAHLEEIQSDRHTLIFYEAPHKLVSTLADLLQTLGNRRIALARELTKVHEEVIRTDLAGALKHFEQNTPKGEFVLIIEGAQPPKARTYTVPEAAAIAKDLAAGGLRLADACKQAAKQTGLKKGDIYKACQQEPAAEDPAGE